MILHTDQVTVTNEVTVVVPNDPDGVYVQINNMGMKTAYIGGANVTVNNGYRLEKETCFHFFMGAAEELCGICDGSDTTVVCFLTTLNE